jgi:hypothetical protein
VRLHFDFIPRRPCGCGEKGKGHHVWYSQLGLRLPILICASDYYSDRVGRRQSSLLHRLSGVLDKTNRYIYITTALVRRRHEQFGTAASHLSGASVLRAGLRTAVLQLHLYNMYRYCRQLVR